MELYNLADDIGARKNIANSNTARRDELLGELLAWLNSPDALVPTQPNPKYDADAERAGGKKVRKKAK